MHGDLHYPDLGHETDAVRAAPLSLSLPHKGGGNDVAPLCPIADQRSVVRLHACLFALLKLILTLTSAAHAGDFYRGKTISLIIGSSRASRRIVNSGVTILRSLVCSGGSVNPRPPMS